MYLTIMRAVHMITVERTNVDASSRILMGTNQSSKLKNCLSMAMIVTPMKLPIAILLISENDVYLITPE